METFCVPRAKTTPYQLNIANLYFKYTIYSAESIQNIFTVALKTCINTFAKTNDINIF